MAPPPDPYHSDTSPDNLGSRHRTGIGVLRGENREIGWGKQFRRQINIPTNALVSDIVVGSDIRYYQTMFSHSYLTAISPLISHNPNAKCMHCILCTMRFPFEQFYAAAEESGRNKIKLLHSQWPILIQFFSLRGLVYRSRERLVTISPFISEKLTPELVFFIVIC